MQIAVALIALVVLGYSLALGFALERIIVDVLKQSQPVLFLNGMLLYYFLGEFLTRYFLQGLPALNFQPYLHLPIRKSRIVNFVLCRSVFHVANIYVFILFAPFAFTVVSTEYGALKAWMWLLSISAISMSVHFAFVSVKKTLDEHATALVALIGVVSLLATAEYYGWTNLSALSRNIFYMVLVQPVYLILFFLLPAAFYMIGYYFFLKRMDSEALGSYDNVHFYNAEWALLKTFGTIGSWIAIELKLIARHKRTRGVFLIGIPFFASLLIIYTRLKNPDAYGMFLGLGILGTGMVAINYGQFLFSWQGHHFDFTLTRPILLRKFVESKYWLLTGITAAWFLLSIPLLYFGWKIFLATLVAFIYNVGINMFMIMNIAMWGAGKVDLEANGTWNYQGMGAAQWLIAVPFLASPYIFYLPFSLSGLPVVGLLAVGVAGLMGVALKNTLLNLTTQRLSQMRYKLAANFRQD